jgi:putative nucleotidyltransferase with HDIG domain
VKIGDARLMAERHLSSMLDRRWRHVQTVAERAGTVAGALGFDDGVLVSAAWLHDIGYAPDIVETGFHPLDGARFLRRSGVDEHYCTCGASLLRVGRGG